VTRERLVHNVDELEATLPTFELPVVVKIDSPDILHKTEAGLVALGCDTVAEVRAAFDRISHRARDRFPTAAINGVLVQEMVTLSVAECIVGMKKDPQFGPTVLFGLGGIFVEVFEDIALRVAPLTPADARAMIRQVKGYRLLDGVRGRPKADLGVIEEVLLRMSRLSLELEPYLAEIDINPFMVGPHGGPGRFSSKAADALVVLDDRARPAEAPLA
jgi:acetyltransferase